MIATSAVVLAKLVVVLIISPPSILAVVASSMLASFAVKSLTCIHSRILALVIASEVVAVVSLLPVVIVKLLQREDLSLLDAHRISEGGLLIYIFDEVSLISLGVDSKLPVRAFKLLSLVELEDDCSFAVLVLLIQNVLLSLHHIVRLLLLLTLDFLILSVLTALLLQACDLRR